MTRMQRKAVIALMACAAACHGKPSPTAPTVAAVRAIGARIDGPASIAPGSSAQLHFVRVTSDGSTVEVTQGRSLSVTALMTGADFSIHQVTGPTNFSGQYRLTITPSPGCGMLPDEVGVQSFAVNLSQFGGKATLQLSAGTLASDAVVTAHVTGNAIDLTLGKQGGGSDFYYYYYGNPTYDVLEVLDGKRYLGIDGVAHLDGSASPIRGTLNGSFTLYAGGTTYKSAARDKTCAAPDHAVVLTR
jgi:hypothetical protein